MYFFIPSPGYSLSPDARPAVILGAAVYMFSHTEKAPLKEIGAEVDLRISYNNGNKKTRPFERVFLLP
jgi:hypothetical protein